MAEIQPQMRYACPDCRGDAAPSNGGYRCLTCQSDFLKLENDILDFLPKRQKVGDEVIYRLQDFKDQFKHMVEIRRYFYTKKLASWSMSWGHKNVVKMLGKKVSGVSVDLGVGCGDHYAYVDNADQLIGVDYDIEAMADVRKAGIKAPLLRADLARLPFAGKSCDSIRSTYAFEHLYYMEMCLEEMYRVLKDDGVLVASFPIVGGWFMDMCSKMGPQAEFKKRFGLDWKKILKVEHCNTSRRIMEAVRRIFIIEETVWSPLGIPSHNANMFITFKARKNLEFLGEGAK